LDSQAETPAREWRLLRARAIHGRGKPPGPRPADPVADRGHGHAGAFGGVVGLAGGHDAAAAVVGLHGGVDAAAGGEPVDQRPGVLLGDRAGELN
jgi:hypothetical protein